MTPAPATVAGRPKRRLGYPRLQRVVDALDDRLRLRRGVFEYSACPDCLFRMEVVNASDDVLLSDGVRVRPGDRLIALHIWNEQFPAFPQGGPTLAWARRVARNFHFSLCELERYLAAHPHLDDVVAISVTMAVGRGNRSRQFLRVVDHFGFKWVDAPKASFAQRVRRFGENILIALMVLARNAGALRGEILWRDRTPALLSRRTLRRRYGAAAPVAAFKPQAGA
jgi:hypothetical protein